MLTEMTVPDLGVQGTVDVIEVHVAPGDRVEVDATLLTLESDKATMEIPATVAGVVQTLKVAVGDKVSTGDLILMLESAAEVKADVQKTAETKTAEAKTADVPVKTADVEIKKAAPVEAKAAAVRSEAQTTVTEAAHAGPGVRRFARELGVSLQEVLGTGPKGRILKTDIEHFVKSKLAQINSASVPMGSSQLSIAPMPAIDFSQFGAIEAVALSRIQKLSGSFLHRNWVSIPHITQFDEADITEMEQFRKDQQAALEKQGIRLTPLVFIMKAVVSALKQFPTFNASLDPTGTQLVLKKYFHLGVAVDTPNGLVVPVVRNVDQKGLVALAEELVATSQKAREGKLLPQDMQGGSFSISSLGGIGGTAFTPIVNAPEVAILGVSKSQIKPVYQEGEFKPRLMLPLSLSYDHRVIDGALAARFTGFLAKQISDIRRLLL